jgi:hypothetical protein
MGSDVRRATLALVFGTTGAVVGWGALKAISWAAWGRAPHPTEFAALLGSSAVLVAALVSLIRPRHGAALALAGALAIWPMYGFAVADTVRTSQESEELAVVYLRWHPGPEPLTVEYAGIGRGPAIGPPTPSTSAGADWPLTGSVLRLSVSDIELLRHAGVSGRVVVVGSRTIGSGPPARAIIVAHDQVPGRVELLQPWRTTVAYVQGARGDAWSRVPKDVPTSARTIRLDPASHTTLHTWDSIETLTGARVGGTAFVWASPSPDNP